MFNSAEMGYMEKVYMPTHTRMGAWLVGVLLGYQMFKLRGKRANLSKVILIFLINLKWTIDLKWILFLK